MSRLRLFPLESTVLFPGMEVPLVVFEERYKQLVAECLADSEPFGVALIKDGREVGGAAVPYPMGTTARLESVLPIPGGRLRVSARGERRFRAIELYSDRPYLSAEVEYPVDEVVPVPESLVERAAEGYRQLERLRQTMEALYVREVRGPGAPGALADAIAAAAASVTPVERLQPLIEALDVRRRLELASALLTDLVAVTHRQVRLVVAQRWGSVERRN
ncbi:MAG: peptidase S16 [Chloroflexi bacterium]|nr:peptidase S16 [Chloroflexota bacterium]